MKFMPYSHSSEANLRMHSQKGKYIYHSIRSKFSHPKEIAQVFFNEKDFSGVIMLLGSLILVGVIIFITGMFFLASSHVSKVRDFTAISISEVNKISNLSITDENGNIQYSYLNNNLQTIENSYNNIPQNINKDTESLNNSITEYYNSLKSFYRDLKTDNLSQDDINKKNADLQQKLSKIKQERDALISNYNLKNIPDI